MNHPRSGTSLSVHHMHTHTHTLVPQEGCRGYTHILTQCSLSPGNFERGARGRLVCLQSHTHSLQSLLVNHRRSGQVENAEVWKCRSTNTGVRKWKYGNQSTEVGVRKTVVRKPEYGNWSTETVSVLHRFPLAPQVESTANHTHACTHTLVPQEGLPRIGLSFNTLTQCSLSSGNSERGARGRLISYSHTHSPFPGEPSQVRDFSVCSSHTHILWYPKRGAGDTHTYSLNVVCPLVTLRGVPGEGLSLTHTHTVRFLVNHPRSGTSLSVHHMHTHTHTLVPQEGCRGYTHTLTHSM